MTNSLQAAYYADHAEQCSTRIIENVQLARDTFRVRFAAPLIARSALPGQFAMLRLEGCNDPLIARPLAVYQVDGAELVDLVYLVKGKFTRRLSQLGVGTPLAVWGPLGNGFSSQATEHLIMVAGGIGQTPFVMLGAEFSGRRSFGNPPRKVTPAKQVTLLYGARTAACLAGLEDFAAAGIDLQIATDDGSRGLHGFVTQLLEQTLLSRDSGASARIVCCGPEPMMAAVAQIAQRHQISCEVSLETPMACGIGICFTCVAKVSTADGAWDYKRTCVEGPIFPAEKIVW